MSILSHWLNYRAVADTQAYIDEHYHSFDELKEQGLDALIITGANVANPDLASEDFWEPLLSVAGWAEKNVTSTLCSCLATHALLQHFHGIKRQPLTEKKWGVYTHRVSSSDHPLNNHINTRFDAPHSRHNDISRHPLETAGLEILASGEEGGVHLATSPDRLSVVYFQGHPEYDRNSLLKEYKREVLRFFDGTRSERPPYPDHYFPEEAKRALEAVQNDRAATLALLDSGLEPMLDNTWGDTAKAIVNNWLGMVYRLTNLDRRKQFMSGVDPSDPLRSL